MAGNAALEQLLKDLLQVGPLSGAVGSPKSLLGGIAGGTKTILQNDVVKAILIWQVLGEIAGPVLEPLSVEIAQAMWGKFPGKVLSPQELADAVVRSHVQLSRGITEAAQTGIDEERFRFLVAQAGNAPAPGELLEMWRRGFIPESGEGADSTSVDQGIREGRTQNKWIPAIKQLRYALPSPSQALRAALEGQTNMENAAKLYSEWGGHPDYFQLMFDTEGSAPTPLEATEMARRGIIPWEGEGAGVVSYHQAFLEGPWRNKWEQPFKDLAVYRPPVRTIVAMVRNGSITDETALKWLHDVGADDFTAKAMLADAHHEKTKTVRDLTTQEVVTAYASRAIDEKTTTAMLTKLRWSPENIKVILSQQDFKVAKSQLDNAINRTRTLFISHHISREEAGKALDSYGVSPAMRDQLIHTWVLERRQNVKVLTQAEIAWAFSNDYLSEDAALQELQAQGYSPRDAWIVLSHHGKKDLKGKIPSQIAPGDELSPAR